MSRKSGTPWWLLALLALMGLASNASADDTPSDDDDDDDDDNPPKTGPGSCRLGQHWDEDLGRCVNNNDVDDDEVDDDKCPPGMVVNAARLRLLTKGLSATELAAELEKYPLCVPETCAPGETRDEFGNCVVPKVVCGVDETWDEELQICVPNEPPPPEGPDPALDDPTIFNDYPSPGTFYQIKSGDYELGVAKLYAASCLYLAAKAQGFTDDAAREFASNNNKSAVRYAAVRFFSCRPQNDMRLGTYRFKKCTGGQHDNGCTHPGANGRGIRFLPNAGDSRERMLAGLPWRRGPVLGKPGDTPSSSSAIPAPQRKFPIIYLPQPDYDALFESNGSVWLPSKATWAGGASRADMPPRFAALGFEGVPDGVEWGC